MGTWGAGIFENDSAGDWLGLFDRLGFMAVTVPLSQIGEYSDRKKSIPADVEQAFLAMCEVVAIAGGSPAHPSLEGRKAGIQREAERMLKLPNFKRRILFALERLEAQETELEALWSGAEESDTFRCERERAKQSALDALSRHE
ncbi:DUF4259 domain-containing protein [Gemmobacter sp. 24YEA27]|uniref:DUF4259 domain-containing protein n=1 Tax=Gemmobacter sp. 24YEA27 TaxID=3040672 RepID=UPI0024B36A7C|nr:DUF4259 domain-containing protein [Gemmobacter sp. 24YEA27]